jgi:hypothetical protein
MYDERPVSIFRVDSSNFFLSNGELFYLVAYHIQQGFVFHKKGELPKDDSPWSKRQII